MVIDLLFTDLLVFNVILSSDSTVHFPDLTLPPFYVHSDEFILMN